MCSNTLTLSWSFYCSVCYHNLTLRSQTKLFHKIKKRLEKSCLSNLLIRGKSKVCKLLLLSDCVCAGWNQWTSCIANSHSRVRNCTEETLGGIPCGDAQETEGCDRK